jgi:FKBP-type peptidyl-prolyl cis-trans isomerase
MLDSRKYYYPQCEVVQNLSRSAHLVFLIAILAACAQVTSAPSEDFEILTTDEETLISRFAPYFPASEENQKLIDEKLLIDFILQKKWDMKRAELGYYFQIIDPGKGQQPQWGDRLKVHYNVYQLDGQIIDSTYKKSKTFDFYLGNVIPGWNDALTRIQVGGKIRVILPSSLAYGEEGLGSMVPPNKCLIFEIELIELMM